MPPLSDTRAIAVIGMACRFPGASDPEAYWRLLAAGHRGIVGSEHETLRAVGIPASVLADPDLVRYFGNLDEVAAFDADAFGIAPARAAVLDPQQRILLELAATALEHAGYVSETDAGTTGVYVSLGPCSYRTGAAGDAAGGFFALTASDKDYGATRISYALDLTGPCMTVQSACSGSLAAVHIALEALLSGQCDMALAGGISIMLPQGAYRPAPGLMLAADGVCRPFDDSASGTVPGNGGGLVVLKPLERALADGDTVHALVLGSAIANDGARKVDYLAPGVRGQMHAIGEAWSVAGIEPATLGMIESHGTGTVIGDPIEIRALAQLFAHFAQAGQPPPESCLIGSVKANIGHLNVASGIAGFIKTVLALREGVIPGTPGFSRPNREAPFADTPLRVTAETSSWPDGLPRRAGISSFGFGGSNVHMVLESPPAPLSRADSGTGPLLLPLSAQNDAALERSRRNLAEYLSTDSKQDFSDIVCTLQRGRITRPVRAILKAADRAEAFALLSAPGPLPPLDNSDPLAGSAKDWLAGETIDWSQAQGGACGRRVPLPTYPFARDQHWLDQTPSYPLGVPPLSGPEETRTVAPKKTTPVPTHVDHHPQIATLAWLQQIFSDELQRDAVDLKPDVTYDTFGVDSLLIVSLTKRIKDGFPEVRSSLLFEHTTLGALAEHLNSSYPAAATTLFTAANGPELETRETIQTETRPMVDPASPIAIIGLAGRFPGADDPQALWNLLESGQSAIRPVPAERGWRWDDDLPQPQAGFIDRIDHFDALFFGITPAEARRIDPQCRLFLETVWAALEDAGTPRSVLKAAAQRAAGTDVGVFVGVMNMPYRLLAHKADAAGQVVQANHWSVANRVSYHFDFNGPSIAVDTACSASLTAVHLACESLRRGECGAAVAGGVNLIMDAVQQRELVRMGMLSPDDTCRAFGSGADGFVQGEGVAAVVLKPLSTAIHDGDRMLGVILGSAVNANGRTGGYTVPSPSAQSAVIRRAIAQANIPADTISAIECHGTGTALGDPIEIAGLSDALATPSSDRQRIAISSIKSNMGHLESAAGIAGLAKVLLQFSHARLVPSLNAVDENPELALERTPFRVQKSAALWPHRRNAEGTVIPRRAGLSGFGAGGSNAHIILEQAPPALPSDAPRQSHQPIVLSAADAVALTRLRDILLKRLESDASLVADAVGLADFAFTLATGREALAVRAAFIAHDRDTLLAGLTDLSTECTKIETSATQVDNAIAGRDLKSLLALWISGAEIDWSRLWFGERRQRIALPTYPFDGPRLWLNVDETAVPVVGDKPQKACNPFILSARQTEPTTWMFRIDQSMPILDQHRVNGRALLPGVVSLISALAAAETSDHLTSDHLTSGLADVIWQQAVEPGAQGQTLMLNLTEQSFSLSASDNGEILVQGRLLDAEDSPVNSSVPTLDDVAIRLPLLFDTAQVHERLNSVGLDHGPVLRAIRRIRCNSNEAIAELVRPSQAKQAFADWTPCPSLLDSALQTACMVLLATPETPLPLPIGVQRFWLAKAALPDHLRVHAKLLDRSAGYARFDLIISDGNGRCLCYMEGLSARLLGTAAPLPLFAPRWRSEPAPTEAPALIPDAAGIAIISPVADNPLTHGTVAALAKYHPKQLSTASVLALPEAERPQILIYVHPPESTPSQPPHALVLLKLLRTLTVSTRPATLVLLTQQAHATRPDEDQQPWPAAAIGLVRTAMQEHRTLQVVCIDVDQPQVLVQALADRIDPLPVAWRNQQRLVLRLESMSLPETPVPIGTDDHVLILGGAGGIGTAIVNRWSRLHGTRFTLIGRRSPDQVWNTELSAVRDSVCYLQADATEPAALAAAITAAEKQQGPITAAVHAALIMADRSIRNMDDETFCSALEVKRLGLHYLYQNLRDRPLRWFAIFSSVNAFAANAGQSNYVAGCAVKDALGHKLANQARFPVRIVNWGYWGEVGRVATAAYRQRMQRLGVGSIATEEGLITLERILAGSEPQVLAVRAEPQILKRLGYRGASIKRDEQAKDALATAENEARRYSLNRRSVMAGATDDYHELDRLACLSLAHWWQGLIPTEGATAEELARTLGLAEQHRQQFDALLELSTRRQILTQTGQRLSMTPPVSTDELQAMRNAFIARKPDFAAHLRLLDACLAQYTPTLRGEVPATAVLFPDMSMALVESMYRGNRMVDHFNAMLANVVAASAHRAAGSAFRVLEFGAGTGGTSQRVLSELASVDGQLHYDYTDISPGFIQHGKKQFGADYPFARFKLFNLEEPSNPTTFIPASYDIVFGSNVIHATRRLERSLTHVGHLLKPGGLLILYEMVAPHDFVTITFGLLPGWWLFEDQRLPHSPLLDPNGWRNMLTRHGFDAVRIIGQPDAETESQATHALIMARRLDPTAQNSIPVESPAHLQERKPLLRGRLRQRTATSVVKAETTADSKLEAEVLSSIAGTLEIAEQQLDPKRSLADYGADSIIGVELIRVLSQRFGIALKPTTLFSYPSVRAIAQHLAAEYGVAGSNPPDLNSSPAITFDSPLRPDAVAVIGMAGRFPGADNIEQFERLLMNGQSSVGPIPSERWDHNLVYDLRPLTAGRTVCPQGGLLTDIAGFDPTFFGLSPAEAIAMDPQQRLFLTACWHALEDAGLPPSALQGKTCAVYAGNVAGDYNTLLDAAGRVRDAHSFMGTAPSMLPARIAYHLDLKGPAISIDSACSSSLVAISEACEALHGGRCELALAGGVALMATPGFYVVASNAGMLSPSGQCRTLDAGADGFVPGEAVAVLVLKRLDRALAEGDRILGVLSGWGTNQDGASNGITAPSAPAQSALIRSVQQRFDIDPGSIDYVELHGTGTRLGDPVELEGLADAFGKTETSCAIGSVKSNTGHTLAAAGAVGLVKVLLSLRRKTLPPTLHLERLNPNLALEQTPFQPVRSAVPWPETAGRSRRAAVSAFGFSGTNAHIIVDEAPPQTEPAEPSGPQLFVLSARTASALVARARDLLTWLRAHPQTSSAALAATLGAGRTHFSERAALVTDRLSIQLLEELIEGRDSAWRRGSGAGKRPSAEISEMMTAAGTDEAQHKALLERCAELYVQGYDIPFAELQGGVRPLSLPGYPFENRRCWPPLSPEQVARAGTGITDVQSAIAPAPAKPAPVKPSVLSSVTDHLDRYTARRLETGS